MAKPKLALNLFRGFILFVAGLLIALIINSYQSKQAIDAKVRQLQHCCFQSLSGGEVCIDDYDPEQATVIVYIHPECEFCRYEAKQIGLHARQLSNTTVLMISPDQSASRLNAFAKENQLWELTNFELLQDHDNTFEACFGTAVIPSVFIYKNGELVKKYLGETKIEAILNTLDIPLL